MQDEQRERLMTCFGKVFRNLSPADIQTASPGSTGDWDSVAHITLLSVVGQEFDLDIDFEDFEGATSFDAILELLRARTANARP